MNILTNILINVLISTHSATGPVDSEPMKAQEAPSSDSTVQEFEAFPPRCQCCDKHLMTSSINVIDYLSMFSIRN